MILAYFTTNFVTLMIISALIVMMAVNRKLKIPATQYFYVMIAVILLLTVLDFLNDFLAIPRFSSYFCKRNHVGATRHKKRRKVCQERLTE